MEAMDLLFLIPVPPVLSAILTLTGAATILYMARESFHEAAHIAGRMLHRSFRLLGSFVQRAEQAVQERTRDVLLVEGGRAAERSVEREFARIQRLVDRDLQSYPDLHHRISEQVQKIDEDFVESADAPKQPEVWLDAVAAVATLQDKAGPEIADVLGEMHKSMARAQKAATREYRRHRAARHKRLARMRPAWRKIESVLERVGKDVNGLRERSTRIDRQMEEFQEITEGTERVVRSLETTAVTRFFVAGAVTAVAFGAALVNFLLIARPMQAIVGSGSILGPFLLADAAAMVLILGGVCTGFLLMESLRITHLFPMIGWLDDQRRRWLTVAASGALFVLAAMGAMLAVTSEVLPTTGLTQTLTGSLAIPLVVQALLAFVLPFALALVALPLESLLGSGRTVAGMAVVGTLRAVRMGLRLVGATGRALMALIPRLYDLLIFGPLWVERMILLRREMRKEGEGKGKGEAGDLATSRGR